ncbi:MAG TPA: phytoene/squalene synthase family protein [Gemmatimonadaceae bacterium]|nr:phytoene/squalene synthase family protein [Gemmatimonadaceae bacterium]
MLPFPANSDVPRSTAADAQVCERIVRRHARTFALASHFLPPEKRRATFALYAFCRVADDIVDAADAGTVSAERRLADCERQLTAALAGRPAGPVYRELHRAATTYGVPAAALHGLLGGVARDLGAVQYASWSELCRYCEGVASTVGEMCTYVFGVPLGDAGRMRALRYARTLGVAMQLTNILRDVGEDAARGRCYLPDEDLAVFGLDRGEVLAGPAVADDERWRPLMAYEVGRARTLYAAAAPGIALLAADAQRCASACAAGYAAILDAIEANGYDTLRHRARVSTLTRASILWDVWRAAPDGRTAAGVGDGPRVDWVRLGSPAPVARLA